MNIQVIARADVPTPPAGERTLFVDSDNGLLTWKYDDGTFHLFTDGDADCCACIISKDYADGILCALKSGMISPADFNALVQLGYTVTATETTDPDTGDKVCTVVQGSNEAAVVAPSSLVIIPDITSVSHLGSQQYYRQFTPANTTNQGVNWFSSDPTKATINASTGLLAGVAAGAVTIYAYSQANPDILASKALTIT